MTVLFGLAAAILYGAGDFAGAFASRLRSSSLAVLAYAYPIGAVLMTVLLPFFPGHLTARAALFGLLGGVAGLVGVFVMYSLMTVAPMNVISPVTAVLAAIVPVVFGVLIGERPQLAAWIGIALGLVGVVLVSRTTDDHPHGRVAPRILLLACLSGLGFGAYFILLGHAGPGTGIWPLVVSRVTSALLVLPWAYGKQLVRPLLRGRVLAIALIAGTCDATANMCYVLATHTGLLSLASVLTSLYPAVTVILAVALLHEHTSRVQRVGLALAGAAVVLITV